MGAGEGCYGEGLGGELERGDEEHKGKWYH